MIKILQPNERLLRDGFTALRAPDGTSLPAVPKYIIVEASEADSALIEHLQPDAGLVQIGIKADRTPEGEFLPSVPLCIKVNKDKVNPKTQLVPGEQEACDDIVKYMAEHFGKAMRKIKAQERQRKATL